MNISLRQKIVAHDYDNVNLRICDLKGNINILTITNMRWAPKFGYNLLNNILLAKKDIEVFLKKAGQLWEIVVDDEVFDLADIIENQYIIWLTENLKLVTVNQVTFLIIETWHAQMGYLRYKSLLKLSKLAFEIKVKELAPTETCSGCMKDCLQ